ncbi:hypothetical protein [Streptomyces sp. NPDC050428]|uniref:hypothetical protein n=1 Tax=Streptomyces sp. NPDC050428 TaxID=3155757 RepID=UPI0034212CE3
MLLEVVFLELGGVPVVSPDIPPDQEYVHPVWLLDKVTSRFVPLVLGCVEDAPLLVAEAQQDHTGRRTAEGTWDEPRIDPALE